MTVKKLAAIFALAAHLATGGMAQAQPTAADYVTSIDPMLTNDPLKQVVLNETVLLRVRPGGVRADVLTYLEGEGMANEFRLERAALDVALRQNPIKREKTGKWRRTLDAMANGTDVLIIGDSDHSRAHFLNFVFGHRDTLDAMKSGGVRDVYLEMNKHFDPYIDAYYKNKISFKEFADLALWWTYANNSWNAHLNETKALTQLAHRLNFIKAAKSDGIRVHASDSMVLERLYEHDKRLAFDIASTARGGRALVVYGAWHGNVWKFDLDDQLTNYGLRSRMVNLDSQRTGEYSMTELWKLNAGIADISESFFDVDKLELRHVDMNGDGKLTNGKMPPQDLQDAAQRRYKKPAGRKPAKG